MVKKFSSIKGVSTWATVMIFVFFVATCQVVKTRVVLPQEVKQKDRVVELVKTNGERILLKSPNSGVATPSAMEVKRVVPAEKEIVLEKSKIRKIEKNPEGKITGILCGDGIGYKVLKVVSEDDQKIAISVSTAMIEQVKIPWADIQSLVVKRKENSLWLTLLAIGVPVAAVGVLIAAVASVGNNWVSTTNSWGTHT